jgi:hypothetical protein
MGRDALRATGMRDLMIHVAIRRLMEFSPRPVGDRYVDLENLLISSRILVALAVLADAAEERLSTFAPVDQSPL